MNDQKVRPRVVVIGAGFGGLNAVHALAKLPVDVVLIDRNNYHLFQPPAVSGRHCGAVSCGHCGADPLYLCLPP